MIIGMAYVVDCLGTLGFVGRKRREEPRADRQKVEDAALQGNIPESGIFPYLSFFFASQLSKRSVREHRRLL